MNKIVKIILIGLGVIIINLVALLTYVNTMLPNVGVPQKITIETSPEIIERGRYLANSVAVCMDCHSTRDWDSFSGPIVKGTLGQGGELFDQKLGFPGKFTSKNITPYSLSSWTDGEILRAISGGVSKDGSALFPVMPHPNYGQLDEKDIHAIIAYLRSLTPIENKVAKSKADFPMNFILNTIPSEANFQSIPNKEDKVAYGEYLITAAACSECHTKQEKGQKVGEPYAGGMEFNFPNGDISRSLNITPDETGIGSWTEEQFINRFRMYADSNYTPSKVKQGEFQTVMPWTMYATMTREDLGAIYSYLQTVPKINSEVERFTSK